MKCHRFLLILLACAAGTSHAAPIDRSSCTLNGIPLHGKVRVVTHFADFDVQVVDQFPDLQVKEVASLATRCGEWQFVDSLPDFTIRYVTAFPDIKIKRVTAFPGVP